MYEKIPKIIHQLWIGDKPPPVKMMDTWKDMNPDFEYIRWTEELIVEKNMVFECQHRIDEMEEINGKADIMRWEILYKYGGVFIDADSFCISPLDDKLLNTKSFAGWEQEELRPGLIATGTMGFPKNHRLPLHAKEWIKQNSVDFKVCKLMAWQCVGPGLLTVIYNTKLYNDMTIFPSYYFLPVHCTGKIYKGHGKVYAYQEWGSTKKSYEKIHLVEIPEFLKSPQAQISVLIPNYNTKSIYIKECLNSIQDQEGRFSIDLVWIDDGSLPMNKIIVKKMLDNLISETRNITLSYHENDGNKGLGYTLNKGVLLCKHEIIMRMDADDIMINDRLAKQFTLLAQNESIMICGTQMECFNETGTLSKTNLPNITWEDYVKNPKHWIISHPSVCFRKSAVLKVGNYDPSITQMYEDFDLWLRMLKKYKKIYNIGEILLKYRMHENQVTMLNKEKSTEWTKIRNDLIKKMISE